MITIIAACDEQGGIGLKDTLPWPRIQEDMVHFKQHTKGHCVIMGRKTFESLGSKPLPSRCNIVISSEYVDEDAAEPIAIGDKSTSVALVDSLEKALDVARKVGETTRQDIFIIGGAKVYTQTFHMADRLLITRVNGVYESDTHWSPDTSGWHFIKSRQVKRDDRLICTFEEYRRH